MKHRLIFPTLACLCLAGLAAAQDPQAGTPYTKPDQSWIMVSGTVTHTSPDAFTLDYGKGSVLVEMDDWDWFREGHALLRGDEVSVDGRVDRDAGEQTTIEANSVFVKGLRTYFYASPEDEEDAPRAVNLPVNPDGIVVQGTVTAIDGREFRLTNELGEVIIDTKTLDYNPMDATGYRQIGIGDVVRVYGELDRGLLEPDEIHPTAVITLRKF